MQIEFFRQTDYPYTVNLNEYEPIAEQDKSDILQKVQVCAQHALHLVGVFFIALKDSAYTNFSYAGTSFKYIVLGYYGDWPLFQPPGDFYLAIFKIVFWVAAMGWGIAATTSRLCAERTSSKSRYYVGDEIDTNHFIVEELELDTSGVPKEIKVDCLKDLLSKINFTDENAPGYMAPSSRREADQEFTVVQLKENIELFIERVNKRTAFMWTPPAHDVPRLMAFYQQIEDALRLSIQKVTEDLAEFENMNGTDSANYNAIQKRKYNDLLHARARVALDLAIAAPSCGSRYMGQSMEVYDNVFETNNNKDLEGTLIDILAHKRKEIAKSQIQQHIGNEAHAYGKYMSNLGEMLGIPGSKNIIEHLNEDFDTDQYLDYFFKEYTVDTIIDTVQKKFKNSQNFREKITDWMRDQVKDWKKEEYEKKIDAIVEEMEAIQKSDQDIRLEANFEKVQMLFAYLKEQKVALPDMKEGWEDFIQEVFVLKEAKTWLSNNSTKANPMQHRSEIEQLKKCCFQDVLGLKLQAELQEALLADIFTKINPDNYRARFVEIGKVEKMRAVLPIEGDTLVRILKGELTLKTVIGDYQEIERRNDFLTRFGLAAVVENPEEKQENPSAKQKLPELKGLSPELMEWLLVSQGILIQQAEKPKETKVINEPGAYFDYQATIYQAFSSNPNIPERAKELTTQEVFYNLLESENDEGVSEAAKALINNYVKDISTSAKRYNAHVQSDREKVVTWIFNQSFEQNAEGMIASAEKVQGQHEVFYPKWKKVCLIQLPKIPAKALTHPFLKVAIVVSVLAISIFAMYFAYTKLAALMAAKAVPFIVNNVPKQIFQIGELLSKAKDLVWKYSITIFAVTFLAQQIILNFIPPIPYLSAAMRAIDLWTMIKFVFFAPQTIGTFLFFTALNMVRGVWNTCGELGARFKRMSSSADRDRLAICKQKCLDVLNGYQVAVA